MTTYWAGNEPEIFDSFSGTVTTNSNLAISGINRAGVQFAISSETASKTLEQNLSEAYVHFRVCRIQSVAVAQNFNTLFAFRNVEDVNLFRFEGRYTNTDLVFYGANNYTQTFSASTGRNIDVYYKLDPTNGVFRFWLDEILQYEYFGSVQFSSGTQFGKKIFCGGVLASTFLTGFSQFLISDKNTIYSKVYTLPLTQDTTSWSGTTSNVTGTATATTVNSISSNTANANVVFNVTDLPVLGNTQYIDSMILSSTALYELGSVSNTLTPLIKTTSNTDIIGNSVPLAYTFGSEQFVYNTNPETTLAWTRSDANNVRFGLIVKES